MVNIASFKRLTLLSYFWIILLVLSSTMVHAQKKAASIWASARFNKTSVMVGEPLVVTVTVYTSTWFTDPPVFSEIQVSGALMVRLENLVGAKTVAIGNKKYPAIEQKFVVYPTIIGENILPSFDIRTTCPPEGDYKGIERIVKTKERVFNVLPPPEGIDTDKWLSSYNVSIADTWDRPLKDLKAGDVLERRIRIRASGTLAAFISPIELDELDFGSYYMKTPIMGNIQNQRSFTGSRTEIITYLIEKDGDFTIPKIEVPWFNLSKKTQELATIEPIDISVAANPDIEFILSRQKALQEELAKEEVIVEEEEEPFEFLGLNWWQLILVVLALVAVIRFVIHMIKNLQLKIKTQKEKELASEGHYLELLDEACKTGESKGIIRHLFFWYDRFRDSNYTAEIGSFVDQAENQSLTDQLTTMASMTYQKDDWESIIPDKEHLVENINKGRHNTKKKKETIDENAWLNLNPER